MVIGELAGGGDIAGGRELRRDCAVAQFVSDGVERAASGNPAAGGLLGRSSRRTADAACGKAARPAAPVGLLHLEPFAASGSTRTRGTSASPSLAARRDARPRPRAAAPHLPQGQIVGVAPGAACGHAKRWPPERMAGSPSGARPRTQRDLRARGVAGDRDAGRAIESASTVRRADLDLIGRTDLRLPDWALLPHPRLRVRTIPAPCTWPRRQASR